MVKNSIQEELADMKANERSFETICQAALDLAKSCKVRRESQIRLQLSAAGPINWPQPKVIKQ